MSEFDFERVFDADYLYFFEEILTPERTAEDVAKIVELLQLEPGAAILDCPCGYGRIANSLAERGFNVTGLDASELFLSRGRADAAALGVEVDYVHGDMRRLPWKGRFDGLINWFTSFGYFSDEQNKAVLREFYDALAPGGTLVLETLNIVRILLQLRPQMIIERNDDLMVDKIEVDIEQARTITERIMVRGGTTRKTRFVVRWFNVPELRDWLLEAGFENVRTPGLTAETRLVLAADRPR